MTVLRTLARSVGCIAALTLIAPVQADTVAQWNFNGASASTVPGGNLSPTPSTGLGTASLLGGATADPNFGSGASNGGSSDPAGTAPPNYAWQTTTYAAQGAESGQRGINFAVNTTGYTDIIISWDQRHSNTSSRFAQLQYSLDGTNFSSTGLAGDGIFEALTGGDTWYNNRTVNLTSIVGAANNANFAFRIVSVFSPILGNAYAPSTTTATYAATGTWRFDMVTIRGTAIPAPGALALLGLAACVARRRSRR